MIRGCGRVTASVVPGGERALSLPPPAFPGRARGAAPTLTLWVVCAVPHGAVWVKAST